MFRQPKISVTKISKIISAFLCKNLRGFPRPRPNCFKRCVRYFGDIGAGLANPPDFWLISV